MVGGTNEDAVDVRIISATHKNLTEMMDTGQFRKDLYYRLNVIQLKMPALRCRPTDIPLLTEMLLNKLCQAQDIATPKIDAKAHTYISSLAFPGNVRELENMLERALALCDGETINVEDVLMEGNPEAPTNISNVMFDSHHSSEINLTDYLEEVEKKAIIQALDKTNNNKTAAAKLLGVTFRTLRYRLAKLGLTKESDLDLESDTEDH
jgi:two-component system response regulator PilR (NtrC family)